MKIRKIRRRGSVRWQVDWGSGAGRHRKSFETKAEAEVAAQDLDSGRSASRAHWSGMSDDERAEVMRIVHDAHARGVTIREIWHDWQRRPSPTTRVTIGQATVELIESRRLAGRRQNYVESLRGFLDRFAAGRESQFIDQVTTRDIEEWVAAGSSPAYRATMLSRIGTLFSFALRRGYVTSNKCDAIDPVRVDWSAPSILTPRRAARVMLWTLRRRPRFLAWVSLALFAGLRPHECDRIEWGAVDLDGGTATVAAEGSKVRQRRIVHLRPAAVEWLRLARAKGAELGMSHAARRRFTRDLRDAMGFSEWPHDILRHTCASYWLADEPDAARIALELGNSPQILMRHYRELVSRKSARQFWGYLPVRQLSKAVVVRG